MNSLASLIPPGKVKNLIMRNKKIPGIEFKEIIKKIPETTELTMMRTDCWKNLHLTKITKNEKFPFTIVYSANATPNLYFPLEWEFIHKGWDTENKALDLGTRNKGEYNEHHQFLINAKDRSHILLNVYNQGYKFNE